MSASAASAAASASASADLKSLKASSAEYAAQIKELTEKKDAIDRQIDCLTALPKYIDATILSLKRHFGTSTKWLSAIRTALTENLTSTPVYTRDTDILEPGVTEGNEYVTYYWNGVKVLYGNYFVTNDDSPAPFYKSDDSPSHVGEEDEDEEAEAEAEAEDEDEDEDEEDECYDKYAGKIRRACIDLYQEKKWKGFKDFNMKHIPILIAYMNYKIERIDEL